LQEHFKYPEDKNLLIVWEKKFDAPVVKEDKIEKLFDYR